MKKEVLFAILFLMVIISACDQIDISQLSDEDLARISEQAIVCNSPYIRFETGCCLDQNDNAICDRDERALTADEKQKEDRVNVPSPPVEETPSGITPPVTETPAEPVKPETPVGSKSDEIEELVDKQIPNIFLFEGEQNELIFTLTKYEIENLGRVDLRWIPYCRSVADVGALDISINGRNIYSAVPVCEDAYRQPIPIGILNSGENKITFETSKGSYSIEQIKVELKEPQKQETEEPSSTDELENVDSILADIENI